MMTVIGIYAYEQNTSGGFTVYTIDPVSQRWFEINQFSTEADARSYVMSKNESYEDWMR